MPTRTNKAHKAYMQHRRVTKDQSACTFCAINEGHPELVELTKSHKVITNKFPYSQWDGQGVVEHLMIVPKKHTDSLNDLDFEESHEYLQLVSYYEKRGYNIYARSPVSNRKTILHQHTHLIKLDNRSKKIILFLRKPRIIFFK
jgi:diadenosine tetraphosphate (Ap4A) HIT family hydrolase